MYWMVILVVIALVVLYFICTGSENFTSGRQPGIVTISKTEVDDGNSTVIQTLQGNNGNYVILLHPSPVTQSIWDPLIQYFQQLYQSGHEIPTMVTYDIRGHGTSWEPVDPKYNNADPTNVPWTFKQLSGDLGDIIDTSVPDDQKVILVGYGFGAGIAQQYAIDNPDKIQELILLNAFIKPMPQIENHLKYMAQYVEQYPKLAYVPQNKKLYRDYLCLWFDINNPQICPENTNDKKDQSTTYMYYLAKMMLRQASAQTHLQTDKMLVATDFSKQWEKADVPYGIRIVTGSRDTLIPNNTSITGYDTIRKKQPGAVFDVVDGKHGFGMTNVKEVAAIICPSCVVNKSPE